MSTLAHCSVSLPEGLLVADNIDLVHDAPPKRDVADVIRVPRVHRILRTEAHGVGIVGFDRERDEIPAEPAFGTVQLLLGAEDKNLQSTCRKGARNTRRKTARCTSRKARWVASSP